MYLKIWAPGNQLECWRQGQLSCKYLHTLGLYLYLDLQVAISNALYHSQMRTLRSHKAATDEMEARKQ